MSTATPHNSSSDVPPDDDLFGPVQGDEELLEAQVEDGEEGEEEEPDADLDRKFMFFQAAPAWVVSTLIHALILLILGLITIGNPVQIVNVLSAVTSKDDGPEMEEFTIEQMDEQMEEEVEEDSEPVEVTDPVETEMVPVETPMEVATVPVEMADFATQMAPAALSLQSLSSVTSKPMGSRSSDMKKKLLREYGGTPASEAAVTEALKWFSRHQIPSGPMAGAWTFEHHMVCRNGCPNGTKQKNRAKELNSATSLALLPFLGAGQTHMKGEFRKVVWRGLKFLIQNGKPGKENGLPVIDYRGGGSMYGHGLATIALCEAYAMTGDPEIAGPAQGALNFIVTAQCRDGGWRYSPRQADGGDTSVVGWQVMALKSGHLGHLAVPPASIQGSILFLDKVQSHSGSAYGYNKPSTNVRPATTAVGLLCRMYTGWGKNHPAIIGGVEKLADIGVLKDNLYYDYYAAQVLRHHGGVHWDKFNTELRDWLVATQAQDNCAKGSWFFTKNGHMADAGRLCSTSFATMILEVYYRHMPLYAEAAAEEDFPL